jgi:hypothetical protein
MLYPWSLRCQRVLRTHSGPPRLVSKCSGYRYAYVPLGLVLLCHEPTMLNPICDYFNGHPHLLQIDVRLKDQLNHVIPVLTSDISSQ